MKVLIISDNNEDISFISSFVASRFYDVIIYRKFLKAIDNIEEIKPDAIIISSKICADNLTIFTAFLNDNTYDYMKIYSYSQTSYSVEKSKVLSLSDFIIDINRENIEEYFPCNNTIDFSNNIKDSQIIISVPETGNLLSGKIINISSKSFECEMNTYDLENGQHLQYVSVYCKGNIFFLSANVIENNNKEGFISLSVCEYYEKI